MPEALAIDGGRPVRSALLPYGRQTVDEMDVSAVVAALRSGWLTTGPAVKAFEDDFAACVGARHAVAVSSGTAALHAAMHALRIGPGDEVIVPPVTFAATANAVLFVGGRPVFADVDADTLLMDPASVEGVMTPRTRAVIGVDFAGQPCAYDRLRDTVGKQGVTVVSDACHALGGALRGVPVGQLADLSVFSFHPVKHVTTCEGGMIVTDNAGLADRMRAFRNHCMTVDHHGRAASASWGYEIAELGFNYRISDVQCALGRSQLRRLTEWVDRRRSIAARYDEMLADIPAIVPLALRPEVEHAYHLYVVQLDLDRLTVDRGAVFAALRAEGIGVNVHYIPVHLQPLYRERLGTGPGDCPVAEAAYERILSLPVFAGMTDADVEDVIAALRKVIRAYLRS